MHIHKANRLKVKIREKLILLCELRSSLQDVGKLKMCHKIILKTPGKIHLVLNKVIGYLGHGALELQVPGTGDWDWGASLRDSLCAVSLTAGEIHV